MEQSSVPSAHPAGGPGEVPSLSAQRHELTLDDGTSVALYSAVPPGHQAAFTRTTPLLVVHSVNAAASAFEMEPVLVRQSRRRPVVALDLPGFGASSRADRPYTPRLMQQAVRAAIDWTVRHHGHSPIDLMALSLGCEFAAQAVLEQPGRVRTLALISPTGMEDRRLGERYRDGATRDTAWLRRLLRQTRAGSLLYRLLATRTSVHWFLSRSWGRRDVDPRLLAHALQCTVQPGAAHAPLDFVSGSLFTRGIVERYRALPVSLWVAHGTQGAFTDFGACPERSGTAREGMRAVDRTAFETGAMPHFERPDAFNAAYERFLARSQWVAQAAPPWMRDLGPAPFGGRPGMESRSA